MPTGLVIALGTFLGTPGSYGGNPAYSLSRAVDGDAGTFWVAPYPGLGVWAGVDLGPEVRAVPVAVRIAPRPSANDGSAFEQFVWGGRIAGSDHSPTSGLTALHQFSEERDGWFRRHEVREVPLSGAAAYRFLTFHSDAGGQLAELEFVVAPVPGLRCAPLPPTVHFSGGCAWPGSPSGVVTITSRTTSASIFYTLDGSVPAVSGGVATGAAMAYQGPIRLVPGSAPPVVTAIAYDSSCSQPVSSPTRAGPLDCAGTLIPGSRWRDTRGRTIEAHGGGIVFTGGYWYWVGAFADVTNVNHSPFGKGGAWLYKSPDLLTWMCLGQIAGPGVWDNLERPKLVYRPATGKWVLWAHGALTHDESDRLVLHESDHIEGPYTLRDAIANPSPQFNGLLDFSIFSDPSGVDYLVAVRGVGGGATGITIQALAPDGLSAAGPALAIGGSQGREAPVLAHDRGRYYLITSAANFYDSSRPFDVRYVSGVGSSPLAADWSPMPGLPIFDSDPTGTPFNSQPAALITGVPGAGPVLLMDFWVQSSNVESTYIWTPLTFDDGVVRASRQPWAPLPRQWPTTAR